MYSAALNESCIAMYNSPQKLENRAKIALIAQEERKCKRRGIISSLIVAFYRKIPYIHNMAPRIASFLRIDFQISPTSRHRALDIVSHHRYLQLLERFGEIPYWTVLLERQMPPEVREHLEKKTIKQLRELCRKSVTH